MPEKTLDAMAAGGNVRPRRRRLPPVLGRPAKRFQLVPHFEKMLYDNAQLADLLPARLAGDRQDALQGDRRADDSVPAARALPRRRRLRLLAGCRHRREGRTDVHVDPQGRDPGRDAVLVRGRPVHHPGRARRDEAPAALRGARSAAEAGPRRQGGRLVERARALRARGVRARARGTPTGSRRCASRSASSCSARGILR